MLSAEELLDAVRCHDPKRAATALQAAPKVGRNAPCPCGGGEMHKKCCGV